MNAPDRQIAQLRVPPNSLEGESSILGGLLLNNDAWDRVGDLLTDEDFYRSEHRLIFAALGAMINACKGADVITVYEHLQAQGKADEVGGLPYLNSLQQYVPSASNIRRYAEIVRERSILRKLVAASDEIATNAFNPQGKTVAVILDEAEQKIFKIGEQGSRMKQGFQAMDKLVVQALDKLTELSENPQQLPGLPTGFHDLDRMTAGLQAGDLVIIAARPSMGKAQPTDARVLRRSGQWARMGDLRNGDALASVDGSPSVVAGVFPQGQKPVVTVTFSDGRKTSCCDEHLWLVHHRKWQRPQVMETRAIRTLMAKPGMAGRLWIDRPDGNFGSDDVMPVDPWLLGALLGDGDMTQGTLRFTKEAQQTLDRVRDSLPAGLAMVDAGEHSWRLSQTSYTRGQAHSNPLTEAVRSLGLMGCDSLSKFIPPVYFAASRESRLGLLRGLLDTDGWVEKTGSVQFSSASIQLAEGVRTLARSLGYWCKMRTKQPHYTYLGKRMDGHPAYCLTISGANTEELFLFDGKSQRCGAKSRTPRVSFQAIEDAGVAECQCIAVSHPSRLYITDDYVVTHNTALAINIAEHVALNEGQPVAVFSMEMGAGQLTTRIIGSIGRVDQGRMRTGQLNNDEWPRVTDAVEKLRNVSMHIDETGGLTVGELRANARRLARQCGGQLGLIVVDYIQLMSVSASMSEENRATAVGEISRGLKLLAKELQCPVIALSQLNRSVESRTDKRPMMSDLRESGAIEQDADVIMFIYRDEYYTKETCREPGVAELIISKQRSGPTGTVRLAWLAHLTRFESLAPGYMRPDLQLRKPAARLPYTDDI